MPSEKIEAAIAAIKAGDKITGQKLLSEIVKEDPSNEKAWLWLSTCVKDAKRKRYCLKKTLSINPKNQTASKALAKLEQATQPSVNASEPESNTPAIQPQKQETNVGTIRESEQLKNLPTRHHPHDQQLIQQYIAKRSNEGWQIVNQTDTSVQMVKPKRWNSVLLVLGGVFLIFFGFGLIFWVLAVIDYGIKSEQTLYITADEVRRGIEKKPPSNATPVLIIVATVIGGCVLCLMLGTILPSLIY
jgi:hypothetical protein